MHRPLELCSAAGVLPREYQSVTIQPCCGYVHLGHKNSCSLRRAAAAAGNAASAAAAVADSWGTCCELEL